MNPVSWLSQFRTARAPTAILLLAGIGLLIPSQTQEWIGLISSACVCSLVICDADDGGYTSFRSNSCSVGLATVLFLVVFAVAPRPL
jgi:hypothetical protein